MIYLQLDLLHDHDGILEYPTALIHLDQAYELTWAENTADITLAKLLTFRDHWAMVAQKSGLRLDVTKRFDELVVELAEAV
jgi:hypothetical protein